LKLQQFSCCCSASEGESCNPFNHLAKLGRNDVCRTPGEGHGDEKMQLRWIFVFAALAGGPALAESPKSAAPQPAPVQQPQSKAVVLASADTVKADAGQSGQPVATQPKHRFARVTTCRCGDPQPADAGEDSPER
jgi:hypothetical protein